MVRLVWGLLFVPMPGTGRRCDSIKKWPVLLSTASCCTAISEHRRHVLLSVIVALFGAVAAVAVVGSDINLYTQIGMIMLIGLGAKNAILIVEFASQEMQRGKEPLQAALDAAKSRCRPILMTAFSFILGVVPLLIASGAGAEARKVMGMTVFSGMLAATIVGVLVVPAMFVFVEKYVSKRKPVEVAAE